MNARHASKLLGPLALFTATVVFSVGSASAQIVHSFESQTEIDKHFLITSGIFWTGGTAFNPSGGVGNSGYLATTSVVQSAAHNQAIRLAVGDTVTLSIYFKARVSGASPGGSSIRLGLGNETNATLVSGTFISASIGGGATSERSLLTLVYRPTRIETLKGVDLGVLTDNHWYQFTATYKKTSTVGVFDVSISLHDWGANGMTGGTLVGSSNLSSTGLTDLYNSPELYVGFGGASNSSFNGIRGFDNFSATGLSTSLIPDPSTYAALLSSGILSLNP